MICQRCGYCCIEYDVIIVSPKVSHLKRIQWNKDASFQHKPTGENCPHLSFERRKAVCALHDKPWYGKTPCARHGQIEQSPKDKCRMGVHMLVGNPELYQKVLKGK